MSTTAPAGRRPILLAHGIAPFDILFKTFRRSLGHLLNPDATRWFDATIGNELAYFRNIQRALEGAGFIVFVTEVNFAATVATRAGDLQREVNAILAGGGHEKVNIIGHSMGGLDARHMILMPEMAGLVASLVTIGTPHLGTSFADWGLGHLALADEVIGLLKVVQIDFTGFRDLTTTSCRAFNRDYEAREAANDVVYITYAASQQEDQVFLPLQSPWKIIHDREGANDGLVPLTSQRWQEELKGAAGSVKRVEQRDVPVAADHLNELGWWHPWVKAPQGRAAYERTIQEMYVQIAQDLKARGLYRRGSPACLGTPGERGRTMLARERIEELIFGTERFRRFTQDSPILPDVWIGYGTDPGRPLDLLLTPRRETTPGELSRVIRERLERERDTAHWQRLHGTAPGQTRLAYNESYVVATLWFDEVVRVVLPLSMWWRDHVWKPEKRLEVSSLRTAAVRRRLAERLGEPGMEADGGEVSADLIWTIRLVGWIEWERRRQGRRDAGEPNAMQLVEAVHQLVKGMDLEGIPEEPLVWVVSRNRPAGHAIWRSTLAVKADAARRLFQLSCKDLRWAVVDSGIDATHPAFRRRDAREKLYARPFEKPRGTAGRTVNRTRILATYDFTRIRTYLDPDSELEGAPGKGQHVVTPEQRQRIKEFRTSLLSGRSIDWDVLESFLRVPHDAAYRPPQHEHGTHVAGILAADWRASDGEVPDENDQIGVCPDLELYDLRVLDEKGEGDEFAVIAALQFIRHLNAHKDELVVHGVNLSLAIHHDVANYACGRTPVCEECERLVGNGVLVVAAAGNEGYTQYLTAQGTTETYRSISITDPGNAQGAITVGATHRYKPHTYGVSYFSSRGPTGDGRYKPDVVAPGEKIKAPVPGGKLKTLDGTSMAAPHVSGAVALLLARHRELIGQPERVKQILCKTAVDLGRERYFQGAGMVDALRALQSV